MSMFGGAMAQAGMTFLNSMAREHGTTFGARTMRPYQNFESPWGKGPYLDDSAIRRTVADARAAGVHPVFALGAQPSSATGVTVGGQGARTGGASGNRLVTAAEQLESRARARKDEAIAGYYSALKAKLEQAPGGDAVANLEDGTQVFPLGTKSGPPLVRRPLKSVPRQSIPERVEALGPKGRRTILNPDMNLDEISQVEYMLRPWFEYFASGFNNKFRPNWKAPKNAYYYWKHYYRR